MSDSKAPSSKLMRQVAAIPLWIGTALDGANLALIHAHGIEALIDVALNEPPPTIARELIYCRFPLLDGAGNRRSLLRLAIDTTARLIVEQIPTLVFCSAGMSRSPAIAAAALSVAFERSPAECLIEVLDAGPRDLSPPLWADILQVLAASPPRAGGIA